MNTENKKLGRGLGALLPSGKNKEDKSFKFINVSEIQANLNQPRKNLKKEKFQLIKKLIFMDCLFLMPKAFLPTP